VRDTLQCRRAEELLSDHLDGTLDDVLDAELRAHVDACDRCRELRDALLEVLEVLRTSTEMEPSADLAERAAASALRAGRPRARLRLPAIAGLPPWVLATAAVLTLALSTGLVAASGGKGSLGTTGHLARRVSSVGMYVAEKKDHLLEDFRMLRVVVETAFEGRIDRVNDRVEDYRRLLERRQRDAQMERSQQAPSGSPAPSPRPVPQELPNRRSEAHVQECDRRTGCEDVAPALVS
jgi:putative zinc finger protein